MLDLRDIKDAAIAVLEEYHGDDLEETAADIIASQALDEVLETVSENSGVGTKEDVAYLILVGLTGIEPRR
jgi:hypothetical protein